MRNPPWSTEMMIISYSLTAERPATSDADWMTKYWSHFQFRFETSYPNIGTSMWAYNNIVYTVHRINEILVSEGGKCTLTWNIVYNQWGIVSTWNFYKYIWMLYKCTSYCFHYCLIKLEKFKNVWRDNKKCEEEILSRAATLNSDRCYLGASRKEQCGSSTSHCSRL